jgi:hypothetical protein
VHSAYIAVVAFIEVMCSIASKDRPPGSGR